MSKRAAVNWLASCALVLAGATACSNPPASSSGLPGGPTVRVLQFNLCDSGIADCFTGRSVSTAAAVIRRERPDVVTLNEVCRGDVATLASALSATRRTEVAASAFKAAGDRATGGPYRCVNGQSYGMGALVLIRSASSFRTYSGAYPAQDRGDPEERVWLCGEVADRFLACTTHTASTSSVVALAQCRYLLSRAVPRVEGRTGALPVILGADLNLRSGHTPSPQSCLPRGYQRVDDGSRQDVITSRDIAMKSRTVIDMRGATDHPGLLVKLTLPS